MNDEKQFVDGLIVKAPGDNVPDFVKAKLSFKLSEFKDWVGQCVKSEPDVEWINVELKESRNGKWYAERIVWKPEGQPQRGAPSEDIPW
jgi:hypothetical protein